MVVPVEILARHRQTLKANFICAHKIIIFNKRLQLHIDDLHCQREMHSNVMNAASGEGGAFAAMARMS